MDHIEEDAPSGTTTAAIPVKTVVSQSAATLYKRKNIAETNITTLVPKINKVNMTESFLDYLAKHYG